MGTCASDMAGSTPTPGLVAHSEGHCATILLGRRIMARSTEDGIELTLPRAMEEVLTDVCNKEGHAEYVVELSGKMSLRVKLLTGQPKAEGLFSDGQVRPITHKFV